LHSTSSGQQESWLLPLLEFPFRQGGSPRLVTIEFTDEDKMTNSCDQQSFHRYFFATSVYFMKTEMPGKRSLRLKTREMVRKQL
jgi:hypothetical protein